MKAPLFRPRIGVDFHTFDGLYQGSRSHILGIYQEAIALAPELDFVFLLAQPERLRNAHPIFGAANVRLVAVPHAGGVARLGWQLALLQRRLRLDLLHVQYRLPFLPLGRCACTIHDVLFETHPEFFTPSFVRMSRLTSRHAVRKASLLFTVSAFSRDEIARIYGIDHTRIAITPNGIDGARFHPGSDGMQHVRAAGLESGKYLCTIGRLEPRKNHINLLRAYAQLPEPRLPLVVIGQRDFHSDAIFAELRVLGLEGQVRFMERVGDEAMPALLRHAAVFVYPTFAEGFGMPVAEAMASGVATVTSSTTALPEVAGDAALTADPHSPAQIAGAIRALLEDPLLRSRSVERGLLQAARFSWSGAAQVLLHSYRRHFGLLAATPDPAHAAA